MAIRMLAFPCLLLVSHGARRKLPLDSEEPTSVPTQGLELLKDTGNPGADASLELEGTIRHGTNKEVKPGPLMVPPLPPVPPVPGAYTPVALPMESKVVPTTQTVADLIAQKVQGVEQVIELMPGEPGYQAAFAPTLPGTQFYKDHTYPGIWGDEGSTKQPGYGGIKTYSVVNITPSAEGFNLYRVGAAESNPDFRCSIYWGFESTYATSIVNAATNIQVCTVPGAVSRCTLTEPVTAIIGQGWNINKDAAYETRGCIDSNGNPTPKGGFVTEFYLNKTPPFSNPPPSTVLQVIIPACQLVNTMSSQLAQCLSRDLPTNQEELQSISDLVALFATANETNSEPIAKLAGEVNDATEDFAGEYGGQKATDVVFDWDMDHR